LVGWPVAKGGSQSIANAMARYFEALGGEIVVACNVQRLDELPAAKAYLFDTGPRALVEICGARLPTGYQKSLQRYRYGPGVYKLDLALSGPIPWLHEACRQAGTVHVGGTLEEIIVSEKACWENRIADRPFVLVAQQSIPDPSRAPAGQHTCWAYCHTPPGYEGDLTEVIISQIERYAPGFRDLILQTHVLRPADLNEYNPNYVGGDIIGGVQDIWQMVARPALRVNPYTTPAANIFLCSSSTPPGGGVHGMCGFHAATTALRKLFGFTDDTLSNS
jgi:phytoene dehydrogenase-like protein